MTFIFVSNSAPITANAATVKKVGVGKSFTYNAKATVKSVKVSKKGIVKATKKGKKVTVKGVKAGATTVTVKTAKKTIKLNVKVGATKIAKKTLKSTMTAGTSQTVSVTATGGKGDTIKFASSNKAVLTVNKASAKASTKGIAKMGVKAVKEGTAKLTVSSKNTGVKKTFSIKVEAAAPAPTQAPQVATTPAITTPTATPVVATTPAVQTTAPAGTDAAPTKDPNVTKDPNETQDPNATQNPDATKDPNATTNPDATKDPNATTNPDATDVPSVSENPTVTASPSAIEFTAKQTGDKKITITNPTAMTKNDIVVKRGNSTVTIDKVNIDEAGTTAVVTLAGSIVATEYTVTVGENSKKFTGEASIVKDIQITSDEVAMDGQIGESHTGFANYAVYNQFGENITAKTSLVANSSASVSLNPTDGTITIEWGEGKEPRLNDLVSVVLMYQNTGVSTSKMLKVATQAAPSEVEIKGVYNRDGKTLSATNAANGDFYYLFRVKDQYGNYMSNSTVHFQDGTTEDGKEYKKNIYMTTAIGMTNVDIDTTALQTINVDGVNYLGFPIDKKEQGTSVVAGDITVMIIPGGSGKTVTDTITVGKGNTVTSLTISVPGSLPSGSTMDLDYVALDENGDDVTNYRVLKEVKPSNDKGFKWIKEDGKVVLRYDDSTVKTGDNTGTTPGSAVSCVFQLPNYETRLVTINVTDAKHVASISGIDKDVAKATRHGDKVEIPVDKLSLQDQYGNSIGTSSLVESETARTATGVAVMVIEEDSSNAIFTPATGSAVYTDKNGKKNNRARILGRTETFVFTSNDDEKPLLGTENVTFKLVQYDASKGTWKDYETSSYTGATTNNTQVGSFTTTLTNTEDKRFVSYDVNTIDTIYKGSNTDADYEKNVEVKGVLSNGEKVVLDPSKDFKVVPGENVVSGSAVGSGNAIKAAADVFTTNDTDQTKTGKYNVVINYTGETVEKTVTIAKADPTTGTVSFVDGYTKKGVNITTTELQADAVKYFMTTDGINKLIKAKDSYGVDATVAIDGKVTLANDKNEQMIYTISDIDTETGKVINNGTATPSFVNFEAGDSFKLTYTVGAATFSTIVSVQ